MSALSECARMVNTEYVITRYIIDFVDSQIPAILPEVFFKRNPGERV